jgi:hypothetical protein
VLKEAKKRENDRYVIEWADGPKWQVCYRVIWQTEMTGML